MTFAAAVVLPSSKGPGRHGLGIIVRAATVTTVAQTVQLAPYKLTDPTNAAWLRDAGPNDTAGALSVTSIAADGKSITFTPASTGNVQLILAGDVAMQP